MDALYNTTWNSKQPVLYGCFSWMIPNPYMGNGCLTKHPQKTGCLEFQVDDFSFFKKTYVSSMLNFGMAKNGGYGA